MKILFLTLVNIENLEERGIYQDLLRKFLIEGHTVYIACPTERRNQESSKVVQGDRYKLLRVRTLNIQKTSKLEKGLGTLLLEPQFIRAIKRHFGHVNFDLAIYSTPPITFSNIIKHLKKRSAVKSYLMLKDIFPQNAVDLRMLSEHGLIYKYFRNKEKTLYQFSDWIGCMSQANVNYLLTNNSFVNPGKVHILPNSLDIQVICEHTPEERLSCRNKYGIPLNSTVFIYGGNLGKPQDIPFVIECLKENANKNDRFFVICGTGTDYAKLEQYVDYCHPDNILLMNGLEKKEYDFLVAACDIGLVFLNHRFKIPNFPSRLLSYMQNSMPVLACTDVNTDIGETIQNAGFGWWCESIYPSKFTQLIDEICITDITGMKQKSYQFLRDNYTVEQSYQIITNAVIGGE